MWYGAVRYGTARHQNTRCPAFPSLRFPSLSSSSPRHPRFSRSLSLSLLIDQCILAEYDSHVVVMRQRLSRDLFSGVVEALVAGAPQLTGVEWDSVVLVSSCFTSLHLLFHLFACSLVHLFVFRWGAHTRVLLLAYACESQLKSQVEFFCRLFLFSCAAWSAPTPSHARLSSRSRLWAGPCCCRCVSLYHVMVQKGGDGGNGRAGL